MDLHRVLLKRNQKANMGPYIPQTYGEYFPTTPQFDVKGAPFHPLSQSCGNIPFKSFNYSDNLSNFKFSPEKILNKAMDLTRGIQKLENLPAMSLTCIVGGFVDGKQGVWNTRQNVNCFDNPLDMLYNEIVNKSMEITRTMSCPDPFNLNNFIPTKTSGSRESGPPTKSPTEDTAFTPKLSYADVTKMNLSNLNKNNFSTCKPSVNANNLSSQKINVPPCSRKDTKVISPPKPYKTVNRHNAKPNRNGTNNCTTEKDCVKPKFQSVQRNIHSRKPLNKRAHSSLKRELGTKKNNQIMDFDGSVWGRDNTETEVYEDCVACSPSPSSTSVLMRVRSMSSDSDCSSEVSECLRNPRVRSLSECSINSVDSEDSFIVFDDCTDDREEESYEEDTSSDEENDEFELVTRNCDGETQADFLQSVNSKWDILPNKSVSTEPLAKKTCSSLFPCQALKQVRFACGEALAKVRTLCVWDFAHRAARIGPWEQAARDRDRFAKRVSLLAPILNPVLDSKHRNKIYNLHFAPR